MDEVGFSFKAWKSGRTKETGYTVNECIHAFLHTYACIMHTCLITLIHGYLRHVYGVDHYVLDEYYLIEHLTLTGTCAVTKTTTSTVTSTTTANSSPGDQIGEQSAGSSDSIWIIWMSLFILFALLTIVAVLVSVYLACLLKKKNKFKVDSKTGSITLVQTKSLRKQLYYYY